MSRRARTLVTELTARGREAGTENAATARYTVEQFLLQLGYTVQRQPFTFNAGVYRALPAAGALLAAASLLEVVLLSATRPWVPLVALMVFAAMSIASTAVLVAGKGGPRFARSDANLIAKRSADSVRCWLVAHLDTKAQAQSMAGRLVALWVTILALVALAGLAIIRLYRPVPPVAAAAAGTLGCIAAVLLSRGRLAGASPGARDNASGLLAVLTAAELAIDPAIGIIITGAEEFGLAGARALAREHGELFADAVVVNVDTVDDEGTMYVVPHGPHGAGLAGRIRTRLAGLTPRLAERRLPKGILVDGIPLSQVAREAATVGRLSWATLRRIHTTRDDLGTCQLATAERLGERLASPI